MAETRLLNKEFVGGKTSITAEFDYGPPPETQTYVLEGELSDAEVDLALADILAHYVSEWANQTGE